MSTSENATTKKPVVDGEHLQTSESSDSFKRSDYHVFNKNTFEHQMKRIPAHR